MNSFRAFACALILVFLPARSQAQNPRWFEVKSGNFILFTDTSEVKGRRLVTDLELRIATFQTVFGTVPKRQFPIEVILFKQSEDFQSSAPPGERIDGDRSAYFFKGPDRMFIVARDKSPDDIANDVGHALGHVFLERMVLWRPFWLEEAAGEYFRKINRNPENKPILVEDRTRVDDILRIVPSSTYKDSDPAGAFRIQSYRLLRIVSQEHNLEFHAFLAALKLQTGNTATLAIREGPSSDRLNQFVDTRIPATAVLPTIGVREIPVATVSIHRGDMLVAAGQTAEAAKWYEGETEEARAARAILGKLVSANDAEPLVERAAKDFPDLGLVQFHFGSMDLKDATAVALQVESLNRAIQLLPLMGRADAELTRVLTRAGRANEGLPLLDRALALEPEYGDRFYLLRSAVLTALGRFSEAATAARMAAVLPHSNHADVSAFERQIALVDKTIHDLASAAETAQVQDLRAAVEAEALRREPGRPVPRVAPPPAPVRVGAMDYTYEATNAVEIVRKVFPDYLESLVESGKSGNVTMQVSIGTDGHVNSAAIANSQIPEMNAACIAAAGKWIFKPLLGAGRPLALSIKLTFRFSIQ